MCLTHENNSRVTNKIFTGTFFIAVFQSFIAFSKCFFRFNYVSLIFRSPSIAGISDVTLQGSLVRYGEYFKTYWPFAIVLTRKS